MHYENDGSIGGFKRWQGVAAATLTKCLGPKLQLLAVGNEFNNAKFKMLSI